MVLAAHALDALAAQAEHLAGLGFGRNLDLGVAVQGGDVDLAAQCGSGEADRHFAVQVVVVALEHGVRLDLDDHVEIARRAAVDAGFAFAGEADAVAFVDAGGNLDRQRLVLLDAAGALAGAAGVGTILPLPWQRGQVCWIEKKPCCMRTWPWPPQVVQVVGWVPGLAPLP